MQPVQAIDFGPYLTNLGTKKKDKLTCTGGEAFYASAKNDILTNASFTVDEPNAPGGYLTYPSVMSGEQATTPINSKAMAGPSLPMVVAARTP